jgi:hypothetical protein
MGKPDKLTAAEPNERRGGKGEAMPFLLSDLLMFFAWPHE